jgi:hypothetical protein
LFTPVISWLMSTSPWLLRNGGHEPGGSVPSAMLTPRMRSLIETSPRLPQSPTQTARTAPGADNNTAMSTRGRIRVRSACTMMAE